MVFRLCSFQRLSTVFVVLTTEYILFSKGDDGGGDTPLPIPNREVKPARADGTAGSPRGRVGRCPFFFAPRATQTNLTEDLWMGIRSFVSSVFLRGSTSHYTSFHGDQRRW